MLTELEGEIDKSTEMETSTLLSQHQIDLGDRKSARDLEEMNNMIEHMDLIGIYGALRPTAAEYTSAHETLTKTDRVLIPKTNPRNLDKSKHTKHAL